MPMEMELTLEQTNKGVRYEVWQSIDLVAMYNLLPSHSRSLKRLLVSAFRTEITAFLSLSHFESVVIEKWTVEAPASDH
ncbi:hypothetical protein Tco_0430939 [Tanacetum coccineum]